LPCAYHAETHGGGDWHDTGRISRALHTRPFIESSLGFAEVLGQSQAKQVRVLHLGNEKKSTLSFAFLSIFRNFGFAELLGQSQAKQVRVLHLGIKKKRVYYVLHSIFRNFAPKLDIILSGTKRI